MSAENGTESPQIPEGERPPADVRSVDAQNPKMKRGESLTSPRRMEAREKAASALEYRKMGASYAAIAQQVGYAGPQGAYEAVMSALRRITEEPAREVLRLELERLDALFLAAYTKAQAGDLFALDACLKVMQRRAALQGLDMPKRAEVTGKDGAPLPAGIGAVTGVLIVPGMAASPEAWAEANKAYGGAAPHVAEPVPAAATPNGTAP